MQQADGMYILCAQEALTDLLGFNNDLEQVLLRVNASVQERRTCQQVCTRLQTTVLESACTGFLELKLLHWEMGRHFHLLAH